MAHKLEHDKLIDEIAQLQASFASGKSMLTIKISKFLRDWLLTHIILDSSVERARVGCWRRVWVGATTLNATAFEEEQHPQTSRQQLNRVRSALTQEVISIEVTNVNFHNGIVKITSGLLRNLGSCKPTNYWLTLSGEEGVSWLEWVRLFFK